VDALEMLALIRDRLYRRHVADLRDHERRAGFGAGAKAHRTRVGKVHQRQITVLGEVLREFAEELAGEAAVGESPEMAANHPPKSEATA
jgi:hypothetical protein